MSRLESVSTEPPVGGSSPLDLQAMAYEELEETPQLKRDTVRELRNLIKGAWKPDVCDVIDLFRMDVLGADYYLLDETTQIAGVVGVLDLEGLSFKHFRHYTPSAVKKLIELAQDCYPMRIKGIYIVNNPAIFEIIYRFARLFLKQKIIDRTHFIGRDYEKLYKLIPREQLPEEYGGNLRNYNYDDLERRLQSKEEFFAELGQYGYR